MTRKLVAFQIRPATAEEQKEHPRNALGLRGSVCYRIVREHNPPSMYIYWFEESDAPLTIEDLNAGFVGANRCMIGIYLANEAARGKTPVKP